jgi:hypothetical protein
MAYRAPNAENLYPADGVLNLPEHKHSHGLRRLAAIESARGSFEQAASAVERSTGVRVGKRQVEQLARPRSLMWTASTPTSVPARAQTPTCWC